MVYLPSGTLMSPVAVYLPAHSFGAYPGRALSGLPFIRTPTSPPVIYLPANPIGASPEEAYVIPTLLWHIHAGDSFLPTGVRIWCNSWTGPCHVSPPPEYPRCSQKVYLLAHPFGTPPEGPEASLLLHQNTHADTSLPTYAFYAIPGGTHVRSSLRRCIHDAPNRLPSGAPISCNSRTGQCKVSPSS